MTTETTTRVELCVCPDPGDGLGPYVEIPLTQGMVAKVSPEDAERIRALKWAFTSSRGRNSYAAHGKPRVSMHRAVLGVEADQIDHRNGDGLDNRRANLRAATNSQNQGNMRKIRGSSRFLGVKWVPSRGNWRAYIHCGGTTRSLGSWANEEDAARARDRAALEQFGDFASLNFTDDLSRSALHRGGEPVALLHSLAIPTTKGDR